MTSGFETRAIRDGGLVRCPFSSTNAIDSRGVRPLRL